MSNSKQDPQNNKGLISASMNGQLLQRYQQQNQSGEFSILPLLLVTSKEKLSSSSFPALYVQSPNPWKAGSYYANAKFRFLFDGIGNEKFFSSLSSLSLCGLSNKTVVATFANLVGAKVSFSNLKQLIWAPSSSVLEDQTLFKTRLVPLFFSSSSLFPRIEVIKFNFGNEELTPIEFGKFGKLISHRLPFLTHLELTTSLTVDDNNNNTTTSSSIVETVHDDDDDDELEQISFLKECKNLKVLKLNGMNKIMNKRVLEMSFRHDEGVQKSSLENLQSLFLSSCHGLNDEAFLFLGRRMLKHSRDKLSNLQLDNLNPTTITSKAIVNLFEKPFSCLQTINVNDNKQIGDEALSVLGKNAPALKTISLRQTSVTDDGMKMLLVLLSFSCSCSTSLENLCLDYCHGITNKTLQYLLEAKCFSLKALSLYSISPAGFDDEGMKFLGLVLAQSPNFELLNLSKNEEISDKGIEFLSSSSTSLKAIQLSSMKKLTNGMFEHLAKLLSLKMVGLMNCSEEKITWEAKEKFEKELLVGCKVQSSLLSADQQNERAKLKKQLYESSKKK